MKRSSVFLPLLLLSLILSSCAEQAAMPGRAFEGTITQVIKVPGLMNAVGGEMGNGGAMLAAASNVNMKIYAREDKLAYEMAVMGGLFKIKTIIDRSSRTITMLMPNKQAFVTDLRSMDSMRSIIDDSLNNSDQLDSLAQNIPKPTGKKMEINGFEVEEYVSKVEGMDVQMWMTNDPRMQFYEIIQDAMLGRQRTGMGGVEEAFAMLMPLSKGKVPVQVTAKLNGEVFATSELTKIEEMELDDEIFAIPAGYTITKGSPGAMSSGSSSDSVVDADDDTSTVKSIDTSNSFRTGKP